MDPGHKLIKLHHGNIKKHRRGNKSLQYDRHPVILTDDENLTTNEDYDPALNDYIQIDQLKERIFKGMKIKVGGYFFKRRDANRNKVVSGFLKNYFGIGYDKRYFQLNINDLTLKYAKDESQIDTCEAFTEQIRNIKSV